MTKDEPRPRGAAEEGNMTIKKIKAEVARMDPNLDIDEDAFVAAVVLLSALVIGYALSDLSRFTGYDKGRIEWMVDNLMRARIFHGGKVDAAEWADDKTGGCAFWLSVACAIGMLDRAPLYARARERKEVK